MPKPIVTGIMAYGMSGRIFHAPFLSTNSGFKLKAIVERREKKAAKTYPEIDSYNSIDELINDNEIELIIVNTPNYLHFEHAQLALKAGKHVLIEKPAAVTSEEVIKLYEQGREVDRKVMVYQNRRYDSGFQSVKEVIESGRLGELIEVHFRFDRYKASIGPKLFKEKRDMPANGLVYDLGAHLVDNAICLFGKPLSFDKVTAAHRLGSEVPDYFSFRLTYPNQLNVYLTSSMLTVEPTAGFVVNGSIGTYIKYRADSQEAQLDAGMLPTDPAYGIESAGNEGKLVTMGIDNQKTTELIPSKKGLYADIFEAVYHTIRNNALFPVTEEQVAWQLELLEY
jgi:scyllo-inositol 2-dehydrogenase (NADP+)